MKPDGGPAFPISAQAPQTYAHAGGGGYISGTDAAPGMTLRDYFAAAAIAKMVREEPLLSPLPETEVIDLAVDAYRIADAMLAERDK